MIIMLDGVVIMDQTNYKKIDGIFALLIVTFQFLGYITILILYFLDKLASINVAQYVLSFVIIVMMSIFMIIKKQGLASIGITSKNFGKSVLLGVMYSLIYCLIFATTHIIQENLKVKTDLLLIISNAFNFLIGVSLFEEVLYRGFINSRLSGLIKNKYVSTVLCGILFSLLHLPYRSIGYGDLGRYFLEQYPYHIILFLLHIIFQSIYDKYHNIAAPVVLHFFYDFLLWWLI